MRPTDIWYNGAWRAAAGPRFCSARRCPSERPGPPRPGRKSLCSRRRRWVRLQDTLCCVACQSCGKQEEGGYVGGRDYYIVCARVLHHRLMPTTSMSKASSNCHTCVQSLEDLSSATSQHLWLAQRGTAVDSESDILDIEHEVERASGWYRRRASECYCCQGRCQCRCQCRCRVAARVAARVASTRHLLAVGSCLFLLGLAGGSAFGLLSAKQGDRRHF